MVHPKNSCAGGYGNCLDVKITNSCNANCAFCIERGGYCPECRPVRELAMETIKSNAETVLILGGEPSLYPHLTEYLTLIRPWKKNIYMTTNGSKMTADYAEEIGQYLDGVNISIHHYAEMRNDAVYRGNAKHSDFHVDFEQLKKAIAAFHKCGTSVRINANLVNGLLDNRNDIDTMVSFASNYLGADQIRFAELQNCEDMWVDARAIWPELTDDPYHDGCEQSLPQYTGIDAKVKMTCGRVNRLRPRVDETPKRTGHTEVLYPNAKRTAGWLTTHAPSGSCHTPDGCHPQKRFQPIDILGNGCHR